MGNKAVRQWFAQGYPGNPWLRLDVIQICTFCFISLTLGSQSRLQYKTPSIGKHEGDGAPFGSILDNSHSWMQWTTPTA